MVEDRNTSADSLARSKDAYGDRPPEPLRIVTAGRAAPRRPGRPGSVGPPDLTSSFTSASPTSDPPPPSYGQPWSLPPQ